jgi:hypothetical protein
MIQSLPLRIVLLLAVGAVAIFVFWLVAGPTPQPDWYHNFADQRTLWGIPHALNVLSNIPFVIVGEFGIFYMCSSRSHRPGAFLLESERWPYLVYFQGLLLTGIGSSYYHADPNNATLVWDRSPLMITFMGLFTGVLAERLHPACARWLLWPLVAIAVGSVFYWDWTERQEAGDLRFYLVMQFLPMLLIPILLLLYPARYTRSGDLWASLLCYGIAKFFEMVLDGRLYTATGFVSGHTMKHLISGLGAGFILLMLMYRQPRVAETPLRPSHSVLQ